MTTTPLRFSSVYQILIPQAVVPKISSLDRVAKMQIPGSKLLSQDMENGNKQFTLLTNLRLGEDSRYWDELQGLKKILHWMISRLDLIPKEKPQAERQQVAGLIMEPLVQLLKDFVKTWQIPASNENAIVTFDMTEAALAKPQ